MVNKFLLVILFACPLQFLANAQGLMPDGDIDKPAPDSFLVAFETSKGNFQAMVHREWAPLAADRFYHLVRLGYYDEVSIYRVVTNFVAQFGIQNDPKINRAWTNIPIEDEAVNTSNARGTIAFARGGPKSRSTQVFINLRDNTSLDTMPVAGLEGYPPFAVITSGIEVIDTFYAEYGNTPGNFQEAINATGRRFLDNRFPGLDYIKTVRMVEEY